MLRRNSIGLFLCIVTSGVARAADLDTAALDRIIETTRKAWDVPGVAVAIVHGEDTVYIKGFGVKRAGSSEPVTPDTRFAICSATKAFTATALGILVDEGKLNWDDPVRKHLPYFKLSDPLADANVTIRDLLCHRTGLASHDMLWDNSPWSREEVLRRIGLMPLSRPFRSTWQYNNTMFLAAGEVVGHIAGTTWEEFVARRLLGPLGMSHSDFGKKDPAQSADYATPHKHVAQEPQPIDWYNLDKIAAAGGINSTVRDLTRWMRLHLDEGKFEGKVILKEATIHETHTPQMLFRFARRPINEGINFQAYGLGWFMYDYRGHLIINHPGLIDGFASMVTLVPDEHYGIAILSNLGDNDGIIPEMPGVLSRAIVDELLGVTANDLNPVVLGQRRQAQETAKKQREEREAKRRRDTTPSLATTAYAGGYEHVAYGTVQVREDAGKLGLDWSNWQLSLEHYVFDSFRVTSPGMLVDNLVQFRLTPSGDVRSVYFLGQEFYRK